MFVKWGLDTMFAINFEVVISSWQSLLLYPSKPSLEPWLGLTNFFKGQQTDIWSPPALSVIMISMGQFKKDVTPLR